VVGQSAAKSHPAPRVVNVEKPERSTQLVEPINLEPRYSNKDIPGKCIRCLAEKELNDCLMALLHMESDNEELQHRFESLVSFLKSPESQSLRDESEKYLAEGRHVTVMVYYDDGKPKYELKIDDKNGGARS